VLTWPQAQFLKTKVAAHNDPFLSIWRLGWIAHALRTDPRHLFDANIFHPEHTTLAYSDATFLEGALAAPFLWAKFSPVAVYNVLLLAGIVTSGIGMFVLVHHLTGNENAALVSAAVFMLAPYRIEHYMHLELQWTAWIPLALWTMHRAIEDQSLRFGLLTGIFLWLQILSCVYYGIFLAILLTIVGVPLLIVDRRAGRGLAGLIAGAVLLVALTWSYAQPYVVASRFLGPRTVDDIARYSAVPINYAASPPQNWFWGWTADTLGADECRLFPGLVALVLASFASLSRPRHVVWIYLAATVAAVDLSFGFNGHLYPWLHSFLWVLRGLRVPARFAILAMATLAVLAGLGFHALHERLAPGGRARGLLFVAALVIAGIEYGSLPMFLRDVPTRVPDVYQYLAKLDRSAILELPSAQPGEMPGRDPLYMLWSMTHWNPLLNGYSGYWSREYVNRLGLMLAFPDPASLRMLRELGVRYILVHQYFYSQRAHSALMLHIARVPALVSLGHYRDWMGQTHVFELTDPSDAPRSGAAARTDGPP
jgi:hypothetical protein